MTSIQWQVGRIECESFDDLVTLKAGNVKVGIGLTVDELKASYFILEFLKLAKLDLVEEDRLIELLNDLIIGKEGNND